MSLFQLLEPADDVKLSTLSVYFSSRIMNITRSFGSFQCRIFLTLIDTLFIIIKFFFFLTKRVIQDVRSSFFSSCNASRMQTCGGTIDGRWRDLDARLFLELKDWNWRKWHQIKYRVSNPLAKESMENILLFCFSQKNDRLFKLGKISSLLLTTF